MGRSGDITALAVLSSALVGLGAGPEALAEDCRRVAPSQFGRVYRANRSALVRVRAEKPRAPWVDGVVIGAEGEILFGVKPGVTGRVRVRLPDGLERGARVLGFDRDLGVGVARLEGSGLPRLVPPPVKVDAQLVRDCWLVVLTHDEAGKPTSHAGQVLEESPRGPARVEVPGRAGSPVLSAEGALVGLAIARGRRQVPVRPMAHLMPFLERVVIGSARER